MMGHKICFSEEIWIIIPKLSLLLLLIWSPGFAITQRAFLLIQRCNLALRVNRLYIHISRTALLYFGSPVTKGCIFNFKVGMEYRVYQA